MQGKKHSQRKSMEHYTYPSSYKEAYTEKITQQDLSYFEKLSDTHPLESELYETKTHEMHLRLFQWQHPLPLSTILPILENFGLITESEHPYQIQSQNKTIIWLNDFCVQCLQKNIDLATVKNPFHEALARVYLGLCENDSLNRLVLNAGLSWREVMVLRAYAKYLLQIGFRFPSTIIEEALIQNANITSDLILLFKQKHNPHLSLQKRKDGQRETAILQKINEIENLDHDTILRLYLTLIKATLRTTYYQKKRPNEEYIAFKLDSKKIPDLPLPVPLFEIYVYSSRFEAIHLRNSRVARGGIRWSDRLGDFRTEILGLMKAQVVKNSVIVPSGAKGGFVLKKVPALSLQKEAVACYSLFIHALLNLTDNIVNNTVVFPKDIVCYDEADPYLVVAADKGTAGLSDIANRIAHIYHYWLGDAFASGGSKGYDHKKIGITAKGAWESIKRHFLELDIDVRQQPIRVVGIGDMSGDVFGNGMLYSKNIKLIAAFDNRNIFVDPNPDCEIAYQERWRLFNHPHSSWQDYTKKALSPGGEIYSRHAKNIPLSQEVRLALDIHEETLSAEALIKAILRAPVDLLYNGGVGTYVKSSEESNLDAKDKSNDYCRIDAKELRCKVVGEGGNLGFTQKARIEFALQNGLIFGDFIDNSGGVDCSDKEVNLKILLHTEVKEHRLCEEDRNAVLALVTQEIAEMVLKDNFQQARILSYAAFFSHKEIHFYISHIQELESARLLHRRLENLPEEKTLLERKSLGQGLTRPELAILLAFTKIQVKQKIMQSSLVEDPFFLSLLETTLPHSLAKKYKKAMRNHPLRKDIIATCLSNQVINTMGITFIHHLHKETGATTEEILRAYTIAINIFEMEELQAQIESLDFKISLTDQYEIKAHLHTLLSISTRFFLHEHIHQKNARTLIRHYSKRVRTLVTWIPTLMAGSTKQYLQFLTEKFLEAKIPKEIAEKIATYRAIYTTLNIIRITTLHHFDLLKTAKIYFLCGEEMHLLWFRDQLANDVRQDHWNNLARLTLRDELDAVQRAITIAVLKHSPHEVNISTILNNWMKEKELLLRKWQNMLASLHNANNIEYMNMFIAIRFLHGLLEG